MTNEEKFNKLYTKHYYYTKKLIYKFGSHYYKKDEDVEDILQQIWMNIWRYIDKIDITNSYCKSFLGRIAINTTFLHFKKKDNGVYWINRDNVSLDELLSITEEQYDKETYNAYKKFESYFNINEPENEFILEHVKYIRDNLMTSYEQKIYDLIVEGYNMTEISVKLKKTNTQIYYTNNKIRLLIKNNLKYNITNI